MTRRFALGCFLTFLALPWIIAADELQGVARLSAMVQAGNLEVTTGGTIELDAYVGAELGSSESDLSDAVSFELEGITVNDLNGDGKGFILRAQAEPLAFASGVSNAFLPIGTIEGFRNPSESDSVVLAFPNELRYERGDGVVGFQVDYKIAYDVPPSSPDGLYRGKLRLELSAL